MTTPQTVTLPNSEQFSLQGNKGEEYLIQVSWPIQWSDRAEDHGPTPIFYLTDGNAMFLTATEAAWRRNPDPHFCGGGIIVAIGYPVSGTVFNLDRRRLDFTPLTKETKAGYGEADSFVKFINDSVRPAIKQRFPGLSISREALYGHSLGGLLVLHALFTKEVSFDCYIASSPSIWYDDRSILAAAKLFMAENVEASVGMRPVLLLSVGSWEEYPPRWKSEPLEKYEDRKKRWDEVRMGGNVSELSQLLKPCSKLRAVTTKVYEGEEHTSVMTCSINRAVIEFFEDWDAF